MGRALRQLEAAGQIKRDGDGNWYPSKDWIARDNAERERARTACHEAAHAVIGLQGQLPLTVIHINPEGGGSMWHRHGPGELGASYRKVAGKYKLSTGPASMPSGTRSSASFSLPNSGTPMCDAALPEALPKRS